MEKNTLNIVVVTLIVAILASVSIILFSPLFSDESNDTMPWSETLLNSAILGGNYLVNATDDQGIFVYDYDPVENVESGSYNILRHAGTVYSMLQLYDVTGDEQLLLSSEKAINYLLSFEKSFDNGSCIVYDDEIKLGGNGLAIIALAEHAKITDDLQHLSSMQDLARYIGESQKNSGEFISKRYYSTGHISDFVSEYYPGEAILSLCRLYALDKNETWLDIAEKGALYLINLRSNTSTNNLVHDHWLVMALNELYRYRGNSLYFNHSMRIAESIMYAQRDGITKESENSSWLGSYYTPPRTTPTATRSEGLVAAYHLSHDYGDENTTEHILNAITLGVQFQLRTQFTSENVKNLPNPQKTVGGFHESLTDYDIRIDYVQHNICSILGLHKIIKK